MIAFSSIKTYWKTLRRNFENLWNSQMQNKLKVIGNESLLTTGISLSFLSLQRLQAFRFPTDESLSRKPFNVVPPCRHRRRRRRPPSPLLASFFPYIKQTSFPANSEKKTQKANYTTHIGDSFFQRVAYQGPFPRRRIKTYDVYLGWMLFSWDRSTLNVNIYLFVCQVSYVDYWTWTLKFNMLSFYVLTFSTNSCLFVLWDFLHPMTVDSTVWNQQPCYFFLIV